MTAGLAAGRRRLQESGLLSNHFLGAHNNCLALPALGEASCLLIHSCLQRVLKRGEQVKIKEEGIDRQLNL